MNKKALLHYLWQNKMINCSQLRTATNETIEILNIGESNIKDHIFLNACLKINNKEYNGSIVIEPNKDEKRQNNAILCVASCENKEATQYNNILYIKTNEIIEKEFTNINNGKQPCRESISKIDSLHLNSYLSRLLSERIEDKALRISKTYIHGNKKWEETLFRILARNFGFGIQSDAFEKWAETLDITALGKHRDNLLQVEAVFFGQAGLLETESLPEYYRAEAEKTPYFIELKREYKFLSAKFGLKQTSHTIWKNAINSNPHTRIARLATMFHKGEITMSNIAECNTLDELKKLLQTPLTGYWSNHNLFGGTITIGKAETISNKHLNLLIINTIVPILYSYGKHRKENTLCNKAENFLHTLPGEENGIIRNWSNMGIKVNCAADTQALIQLKKEYCNKRKCIECLFTYRYLKEISSQN